MGCYDWPVSRAYHVAVAPLVSARVDVEQQDELCVDVALLPILGEQAMRQLLLAELAKDGWQQTADGGRAKELRDGLTATLGPDGKTVTVTMTARRTVVGGGTTKDAAETAARDSAARAESAVKREATTTLARAEGDVRAALDVAVQRVYVEALQQKARSLGTVESMQTSEAADGSVEITIKVRA